MKKLSGIKVDILSKTKIIYNENKTFDDICCRCYGRIYSLQ